MLIKAADGLVLRDPATRQRLASIETLAPELRAIVEKDSTPVLAALEIAPGDPNWLFWDRRLRDGDVLTVAAPRAAATPSVPTRAAKRDNQGS